MNINNKILLLFLIFSSSISCRVDPDRIEYLQKSNGDVEYKKYENNKLIATVGYLKDSATKNDKSIFYDGNGHITKLEYWFKNVRIGSYYEFQNNYPITYGCFDIMGDTLFWINYIEKKMYKNGDLAPKIGIDDSRYLENKNVIFFTSIPKPPKCKVKFETYLINQTSKDTIYPIGLRWMYDWVHHKRYKLNEKGNYKFIQYTTIIDTFDNMKVRTYKDTGYYSTPNHKEYKELR